MEDSSLRQRIYRVIFGTDTPAGRLFDLVLIYAILLSVAAVMLDSVAWVADNFHTYLYGLEWFFTVLFTIEYILRVYSSPRPFAYIRSFYGVIDLLAILPTYLGIFVTDVNYLLILRLLRVLRIFRILKLVRYLTEANVLLRSMLKARRKILIFFMSVLVLSTVFGSLMFVVEGPQNGFSSIPKSIYWTIVTITTVGYGDIVPQTMFGQVISAMAMLTGYSIIAVPTGILTAELSYEMQRERIGRLCRHCNRGGHEEDAAYCRLCGGELAPPKEAA
ncbi:ion transporter [Exilibacterium tricleocarpae]|uniref:Ion transporter n=2 Tax=Exilibacterium tricleocarpae TaxID=2591008 RepID=A0A545UA30_9GAMM|nr:ion transporter [Exilibacterium tricleocarpae]TQV86335.1 ion transporter [Exilibacterium tricleocarpae]